MSHTRNPNPDAGAANSPGGTQRPVGRRTGPARKCVTELAQQASVDQIFLATQKQLRPNRNGQLYLQVELADRSGSITGRMWNASDEDFEAFDEGDYVRVEGTTQLFSGSLQIIIAGIGRVDPRTVEESDFLVLSAADVERLSSELASLLGTIASPPLKALADEVLADRELMEAFRRSPAGVKQHHAHAGGLLDHVVNLLRLADRVAPLYPALDRDLLLIGVLFHDIGKTVELESERGFSYTDAGQLLGHVLLGLEILESKIQSLERRTGVPLDDELAIRVKHMIASHHGQYEFGAPKLPMTLEALALHHLDHLDARMAGVLQLMQNEASIDGGWTQYQQNLGRKFFRGRSRD
jgi:3'-5' exoribonuclease